MLDNHLQVVSRKEEEEQHSQSVCNAVKRKSGGGVGGEGSAGGGGATYIEDRTAPHKLAEHYRLGLTSNQHLDVFGSKESLHLAHRGQVCQGVPFLGEGRVGLKSGGMKEGGAGQVGGWRGGRRRGGGGGGGGGVCANRMSSLP